MVRPADMKIWPHHRTFDAVQFQHRTRKHGDRRDVPQFSKSANCGTVWSQTFSLDPFGKASKTGNLGITFTPGFDQTKNWFLPVTGPDSKRPTATRIPKRIAVIPTAVRRSKIACSEVLRRLSSTSATAFLSRKLPQQE